MGFRRYGGHAAPSTEAPWSEWVAHARAESPLRPSLEHMNEDALWVLGLALFTHSVAGVHLALAHGAHLHAIIEEWDQSYDPPRCKRAHQAFSLVAQEGIMPLTPELLRTNAPTNVSQESLNEALYQTLVSRHQDASSTVAALLAVGAAPDAPRRQHPQHDQPLHTMAGRCYDHPGGGDIMRQLIAAGADVNAPNKSGGTPLMAAVYDVDDEALMVLCGAGADPSMQDLEGNNVLHHLLQGRGSNWPMWGTQHPCLELLSTWFADPAMGHCPNTKGRTPWDLADELPTQSERGRWVALWRAKDLTAVIDHDTPNVSFPRPRI